MPTNNVKLLAADYPDLHRVRPSLGVDRCRQLLRALWLLAKPGIVAAQVMTGLAGMLLASPVPPDGSTLVLGLCCIALTGGGAAMANVAMEQDHDHLMPRVARRCRAMTTAGVELTITLAVLLMAAGMLLAIMATNLTTLVLLVTAASSYLWLYTGWLKRRSPWSVLVGAVPGALPPIIGGAAISATISPAPLLLGAIIFLWQLPHFWFLALRCQEEYRSAGIPVLPLTHGIRTTEILILLSTLALLPLTITAGFFMPVTTVYPVTATVAGTLFLLYSCHCLFSTRAFNKGFTASLVYLALILGAILFATASRFLAAG